MASWNYPSSLYRHSVIILWITTKYLVLKSLYAPCSNTDTVESNKNELKVRVSWSLRLIFGTVMQTAIVYVLTSILFNHHKHQFNKSSAIMSTKWSSAGWGITSQGADISWVLHSVPDVRSDQHGAVSVFVHRMQSTRTQRRPPADWRTAFSRESSRDEERPPEGHSTVEDVYAPTRRNCALLQ